MKIRIKLLDLKTNKSFYKYFDTEYNRDKFINKLKYSKKIIVIDNCKDEMGWID